MRGRGRYSNATLAILEKVLGPEHPNTNRGRHNLARLLLASGNASEALALGETALAAHDEALGPNHNWTKDSSRVTADALDALGRADEAKALREKLWGGRRRLWHLHRPYEPMEVAPWSKSMISAEA